MMNENLKAKLNQLLTAANSKLDGNKRWGLLAGAAVVITALIVGAIWNNAQDYTALFGRQQDVPVSAVVSVLDGEHLDYRIDPASGQILVPKDALSKTRMTLAGKGVQALLPDGYALMDKDEVLGSSQFVQNIRYKRSLEGELAKSIMTLDAVENARVHLALNEESSFVVTHQPENSASVAVRLHYGNRLTSEQVNAIVHLVSGSIPGLNAAQVSVVDQAGNLLSDGVTAGAAATAATRKNDRVTKEIQDKTRKSIENVLISLVGKGNYRISVMPQLDLSDVDETLEHYGDEPKVNREEQAEDANTDELALGIPGALSNRPPQAANNAAQNPGAAANPQNPRALSSHKESKRDFSYDRNIQHIKHPGFAIKRLNVAVMLNRGAGAVKNWKEPQIQEVTTMLNTAAGIDARRGDSLSLSLMNFVAPDPDDIPTLHWWQDEDILSWARLIGCGIAILLLLLMVVRPLMKRATALREQQAALLTNEQNALEQVAMAETGEERKDPELPSFPGDDELPSPSSGLEAKLEYLQKLALNDTDRVAEVIRQWITSNERIDNK